MSTSEKSFFALSTMTVACALAFGTFTAQAANVNEETVHKLDKVTVDEAVEKNGQTILTAEKLEMAPSSTGTITDAFRSESFIQFDQNSRDSGRGADITPPQISIRGGRHFENNFTINGLSNNNNLNPNGWKSTSNQHEVVNSDAQGLMLSTDLLDNVTIMSENISAEYGEFVGGVVDAQIRDARSDRWHMKTWVRHTRDSWAHQHWMEEQEANEFPVTASGIQRDFKRTNAGITLDGPLADGKLGAMVSYEKVHSSTPVFTFAGEDNEYKSERDMDTFLVRVNTDAKNDFYAAATLIYSPYESSSFGSGMKGSHFEQHGGGWNFTLNTRANLSIGTWKNDFGFSRTESTRDCDTNIVYEWNPHEDGYANWPAFRGVAQEGARGDAVLEEDQFKFKSVLALNPLQTGALQHNIRVGAQAQYTKGSSDIDDWVNFFGMVNSDKMHGDKADGIISGEQGATMKWIQRGVERDIDYTELAAFVEDSIKYDRFTVRPGVRVSYDEITKDVNVAPRFFANMDVLNDGRFNVNFGANRYYGGQVLYQALVQGALMPATRLKYKREWDEATGSFKGGNDSWKVYDEGYLSLMDIGDVDNPYVDEFTLGASAVVYDTLFKVTAVKRDYKDQLRWEPTGDKYSVREMSNNGETEYKGVTFSMEKAFDLGKFGRHTSELGITWSDTKTNVLNFANVLNETSDGTIILDEKVVTLEDLPANNFNADWVITYNHNASFMDNRLRANMLLRWESGSERVGVDYYEVSYPFPDFPNWAQKTPHYTTHDQDHMFNADLSVAYDLIKTANSTLTLNMDVLNVFDNKNLVNTTNGLVDSGDLYSMGRQFFIGMSYEY